MTKALGKEILDQIEQRCAATTPGPWVSSIEGRDHWSGSNIIITDGDDIEMFGATVADFDFVANARQDITMLVAEVRRLQDLLEP